MPVSVSSSIFDEMRETATPGGWSDAQLAEIVGYIDRSPIYARRVGEFEAARGKIRFETSDRNYFWQENGIPLVYFSPRYKNTDDTTADIQTIAQVLAHEMSHFETCFGELGLNPNTAPDENAAGAAGVYDEARAYALEYLVQCEINATEPRIGWVTPEQEAAARRGVDSVVGGGEVRQLEAASLMLLDWAANWTDDESKGGYFQYYQNEWLTQHAPGRSIASSRVHFTCDPAGRIIEVEFHDAQDGPRVAIIDPAIARFAPRA